MKVLFFSLIGVAGIVSYVSALPYAKRAIDSDPRAKAVKSAFRHAWKGYSAYAFGHDELLSNSNHYSDSRYLKQLMLYIVYVLIFAYYVGMAGVVKYYTRYF